MRAAVVYVCFAVGGAILLIAVVLIVVFVIRHRSDERNNDILCTITFKIYNSISTVVLVCKLHRAWL